MDESNEGSSETDSTVSSRQGEGPDITSLPWEVLQEICNRLDGISLMNCKRVCRLLRDHVHHLEQNPMFWYNNCQKDVPTWVQLDLLDNMFPNHWKDQTRVDWEEVYKCWYFWNSVYEAPVTVHRVVTGITGVSAIKISGEWLLITTCQSGGRLIAQRLTGSGQPVELYVGGGAILNFELVTSDNNNSILLKPPARLQEVFETLEHNEIWLEYNNHYIQLGKTYYHTIDKIKQKISHSYGYEIRLYGDHNRSSIILKKICCAVRGPVLMELELSTSYCKILDFWMNTIVLFSGTYRNKVAFDTLSVDLRTQQASLTWTLDYNVGGEAFHTYTWQGSLFVAYTEKRNIVIYKDDKEKIQVTPIKKGQITSVLFYVNHFFAGTNRGQLLIYKVKTPQDCTEIEFYSTPCWTLRVSDTEITSIAIAEPMHHKGKGPVIICAGQEAIYTVSISI